MPSPDAPVRPPPDANTPPPVDGGPASGFRFAIVGDTRPPVIDDTSGYPTAIITKIWSDVEALSPRPDFAVSTGDYMFASTSGSQAAPQLDKYLGARMHFTGTVYAAGNAWTSTQATWLAQALSEPTTYTFVIRHESNTATTAPGVSPSKAIIDAHPLTLLIVGHAHTYQHLPSDHEVISGNGGAPLTTGSNYGYATVERRADGVIEFKEYDYQTNAVVDSWAVHADGSPA